MKYTTKWQRCYQDWGAGACAVAMVWLVALAGVGAPLESLLGWVTCPAWVIGEEGKGGREQHRSWAPAAVNWRAGWEWLRRSWVIPAVRSAAGAGVSGRAVGMGRDLPGALGSVGVERSRHCLA